MKQLTPSEQAAIYLHIFGHFEDRRELFKIAVGEKQFNKLKESSLKPSVSRWYNSPRIQEGIKAIEYEKRRREEEIAEQARKSQETEPSKQGTVQTNTNEVNFLNPDEFLKFASQKANEIQDEKDRREYLKMIANLMNYKDSDREETEIQRFYTPVNCLECEIYKKCGSCSGCNPSCD
jgi:hypothetical protein